MSKMITRFVVLLIAMCMVLSYLCLPYAEHTVDRWFEKDLQSRSQLVFSSIQQVLEDALSGGNSGRVQKLFDQITQNKHLLALGYCNAKGDLTYQSGTIPADFSCKDINTSLFKPTFTPWQNNDGAVLVARFPVASPSSATETLVIFNDLSFVAHRHDDAHKVLFVFLLSVCLLVTFITVLITFVTLRSWLNTVRLLLQIEKGQKGNRPKIPSELKPLLLDLYRLMRRRRHNRKTVNPTQTVWSSDSMRRFLAAELPNEEVIVVSNLEPYVHNKEDSRIVIQTPVSGLVSALEPVMRACKGTWIAHGRGSADKATVDSHDRISVPPDNPSYTLRRVWLNEKEENGYYYGFSNEGWWPLCHLVYTRPIFRDEDWEQYQAVNRKFADAVVAEAKTKSPIILVQDFHFALLPAMIHERLPKAIVATFWHIPWPNVEAFSICPWREELLKGMLGSDILGFHTQFHCNNFFDTADRVLECRIDRERATVTRNSHASLVKPYPISIEWLPSALKDLPPASVCRENILQKFHLPAHLKIGVGVERFDYTKGIADRFQAIARFFRQNPSWVGKLSFIQIAAPTRVKLQRYRDVSEETIKLAESINTELGNNHWNPILLISEQYDQRQVFELFRASDFCLVSSLHDGMNLVAKEFVASREDERGVLILSTFAGASEELLQALIVNPHDLKGMAEAIHRALTMNTLEQQQRMHLLRTIVRDHNIFWWAGQMLLDIVHLRRNNAISLIAERDKQFTDIRSFFSNDSIMLKWLQTRKRKRAA